MKMLSLYARRFLAIAALFVLWSASPAWAADLLPAIRLSRPGSCWTTWRLTTVAQ